MFELHTRRRSWRPMRSVGRQHVWPVVHVLQQQGVKARFGEQVFVAGLIDHGCIEGHPSGEPGSGRR